MLKCSSICASPTHHAYISVEQKPYTQQQAGLQAAVHVGGPDLGDAGNDAVDVMDVDGISDAAMRAM